VVLLGAIWVSKNGRPATAPVYFDIAKLNAYPGLAISTLRKLDYGNRIVDRCRYFLEQFNNALDQQGTNLSSKI
jgi:hypothetical protein